MEITLVGNSGTITLSSQTNCNNKMIPADKDWQIAEDIVRRGGITNYPSVRYVQRTGWRKSTGF